MTRANQPTASPNFSHATLDFSTLLPRTCELRGADRYVCRSGSSVGREFASFMTVSQSECRMTFRQISIA